MIKNSITNENRNKILDAICEYNQQALENHYLVYSDKSLQLIPYEFSKTYYETLFNLFDWSCKNSVSPDVYEKIKPYL
jgi:hypothetical protein